ncbi:hypothetical protein ACPV5H_26540 [Vibrio harveyi]|uniref:hypothetical protein n=1 Tax=Vibrio harveyi group TaxID=717610 RepID=UPI0028958AA4|nr:hypothetical protein [Vibrio alginolyticus]CAH1590768.1 conserved hypothetical protein [Vibrio rotiferianus]CAH1592226.1 conserved hypothetical protein [Vibrio rotiferianus]
MTLLVDLYPEHSDLIKFGDQAEWTWQCFVIAKQYCNNEDIVGWCGLDEYLAVILKEYSFLQIAKLHDRDKTFGNANNSLEYYLQKYDLVNDPVVNSFKTGTNEFYTAICNARKKTIAHSDLAAVQSKKIFGAFPEGADDDYFEGLHSVLERLYEAAGIGPFSSWSKFVEDDMEEFFSKIKS